MRGEDKAAVCHLYAAEENADMLCKKQWLYSNPALGVFRSFKDLETNLVRASRMPSSEAGARNLLLNQRISLLTLAVSPAVWRANKAPINEELFFQYPVHIGLDLSARNDLTAAVLSVQNPEDNHVHVKPIVFTPLEHLAERELSDRAPYSQWVRDGHMYALPGSHLDYKMIAETLKRDTKGMAIASVSFDRWRIEIFKAFADEVGFASDAEWISVGQGFRDFGLRVDGMDTLLLQSRIHHGGHPLLNLAASNAIVVSDPTGARKYDKSKSSQRIDPLVAMAMSVFPLSDGATVVVDIDGMMF
jgi:phage terminase large subunit-like protein